MLSLVWNSRSFLFSKYDWGKVFNIWGIFSWKHWRMLLSWTSRTVFKICCDESILICVCWEYIISLHILNLALLMNLCRRSPNILRVPNSSDITGRGWRSQQTHLALKLFCRWYWGFALRVHLTDVIRGGDRRLSALI